MGTETQGSLFFVVSLLIVHHGRAKNLVTCDGGTAYIGEPSTITCNFNTDIKNNKISVSVSMTRRNQVMHGEDIDVLQCSWSKQTSRPQCLVEDGYAFDFNITDSLSVGIPAVTAAFAGSYSCHIVPPNGAESQTCILVVKERTPSPPDLITTLDRKELLDQHTGSKSDPQNGKTTAILVLLIMLILFVAGVFVFYILKKKGIHLRFPPRKTTTIQRHDEDPAEVIPLKVSPETTVTLAAQTQTEVVKLCDAGTDCPTDLPTEHVHKELSEKAEGGESTAVELDSQPTDTGDKHSKSKQRGTSLFGFKKSKKDKDKVKSREQGQETQTV